MKKVPCRLTLSCEWRRDGLPVSCKWQSWISEVMSLCKLWLCLQAGGESWACFWVSAPCPEHTCSFLSGYLHNPTPRLYFVPGILCRCSDFLQSPLNQPKSSALSKRAPIPRAVLVYLIQFQTCIFLYWNETLLFPTYWHKCNQTKPIETISYLIKYINRRQNDEFYTYCGGQSKVA